MLQSGEIAASKLTRVNYAFANIQNGEMVEGFPHDAENFAFLTGLKKDNPQLQVLISVGGWTWSGGFSEMALTAASRAKFIDSAVGFVQKYKLDGLDIDWEYPGLPGAGNPFRPEDSQNFTALVKELRVRFDREAKRSQRPLLISIAAGAAPDYLEHTNAAAVARYVDTINLMSYDYYEPSSSSITGHHAPLYANPLDPRGLSADASVRAYLAAGVPAKKIVLGVPFYGHAWSDAGATNHGLFQPAKAASVDSSYNNIVSALLTNGFTRYWDEAASAPYLYNAGTHTFISYEDPESVALKAKYVLQHHLGGIMFWEYHSDSNGALLDAIDRALGR